MSESASIPDPGEVPGDELRIRLLQVTIVAATLAWSLNLVSFLDAKEGALWTGVLLLAFASPRSEDALLAGFSALGPCWAVLGGVVVIGALRSPVPALSVGEGLRLLPVLLLATLAFDLLQHPIYRIRILRAIVVASVCAASLALLQRAELLTSLFPRFDYYNQTMYSVFGNEGLLAGVLATAIICLPGTRSVAAKRRGEAMWLGAATFLMGITLLLTESRGGLMALVAGLFALWMWKLISMRTALVAGAGGLLCVLLLHIAAGSAPWDKWLNTFTAADTGGNFRRWTLQASLALIGQHPILGCGLGHYSRAVPILLGTFAPADGAGANELFTEHAHADLVEWISETGVVGAIGLCWVLSRVRIHYPVALCGLIAMVVFSMSHPAFYSAPHVLVGLLFYAMNTTSPEFAVPRCSRRVALVLMRGTAIIGATVFGAAVLYPSYLLCRAEDRHLAGEDAWQDYEGATRAWGFHPDAFESYGIYCFEQGEFEQALKCFDRARAGLDTGKIYQLSAMAAAALGDHESACSWYEACLLRWPWDARIRSKSNVECGHP